MGSFHIVMSSLSRDFLLRIVKRQEPVLVQTLGAQLPVECFDQNVIRRLSRPAEVQTHSVEIRPLIESLARKLAPIVHTDLGRERAPLGFDPVEHTGDVVAPQTAVDLNREALACEVLDYRQEPKSVTVEELVGHEVHAPALVDVSRRCPLGPRYTALVPARLVSTDAQSFFPVEPVHPLTIHWPAFPAQLDPDSLVAPRDMHFFDITDSQSQHGLIIGDALVAVRRARRREHAARTPLADVVRGLSLAHHLSSAILPCLHAVQARPVNMACQCSTLVWDQLPPLVNSAR